MPSKRDVQRKLRKNVDDARERREAAVFAVNDAAAAAVKVRRVNDAALRSAFEAALKNRDVDRVGKLRETFESVLAGGTQVVAAEVIAGRAVNSATDLKVVPRITQAELVDVTEQRVEDLRRWAQLAKQADADSPRDAPVEHVEAEDPRPVTGFSVVAPSSPAEGRGEDEGSVAAAS